MPFDAAASATPSPNLTAILNAITAAVAAARAAYPTLEHVRQHLMGTNEEQDRRDAFSIATFAKWTGRPPRTITTDPETLRADWAQVEGRGARAFGVSRARLKNVGYALNRALRRVGVLSPVVDEAPLTPRWLELRDGLDRAGAWSDVILKPFMAFCSHHGIAPEMVTEETFATWHAYRRKAAPITRALPDRALRRAKQAWNRGCDHVPGWPRIWFDTAVRRKRVTLPLHQFPVSFQQDVEAYARAALGQGSAPAAGIAAAPVGKYRQRLQAAGTKAARPLAKGTVKRRIDSLLTVASALVAAGEFRLEDVRSIEDVVQLDPVMTAVEVIEGRNGRTTEYELTIVKDLQSFATRWLNVADAELEEWRAFAREVQKEGVSDGMTAKNRERLSQFDDPQALARLLNFPTWMFAELEHQRKAARTVTQDMALDMMAAIAVMLLQTMPVRRANLVAIDLRRNITWPAGGKGPGSIHFDEHEVKNQRFLKARLTAAKIQMLRVYLEHYRPLLTNHPDTNPYLFPAVGPDGYRHPTAFSGLVCGRVKQHVGVEMNLHLWRHLLVCLAIRHNPTLGLALAADILGHSPNSKATRRYAEIAQSWAVERLSEILDTVLDDTTTCLPFRQRRVSR